MPMPRFSTGTAVTSSPATKMRPRLGCSKPASMVSVVVLPEPEGPSRVRNSPASTSRLRARTASTLPS